MEKLKTFNTCSQPQTQVTSLSGELFCCFGRESHWLHKRAEEAGLGKAIGFICGKISVLSCSDIQAFRTDGVIYM